MGASIVPSGLVRQLTPAFLAAAWFATGPSLAQAEERAAAPPPVGAERASQVDPRLVERDRLFNEAEKLAGEGKHAETIALAEKAMAIEVDLFGEQSQDVAGSWSWIGQQRLALDQLAEAIAAFEREASIWSGVQDAPAWRLAEARRKVAEARQLQGLSPERRAELRRATALNFQGMKLHDHGKYQDAAASFKEALALRQKILGAEHRETAESLNNLGGLFDVTGDYATARAYYEQALAINRKVLGEEHPGTAGLLNNLGSLFEETGDYSAARDYYEQALAIKRKALGEEHYDTTISLNNMGSLLQATGDYAAAQSYIQQSLAVRRKIFGEDHPLTAGPLSGLGLLLQAKGDYAAARPYLEKALAINRKELGEGHPHTAAALNNLGLLLASMGDYAAARPYYEQALAIDRKVFGEEHPDTASLLGNLGNLLVLTGDLAAARPYLEQALAINRKALGEEHSSTARSLNYLGVLYDTMRDYPAARGYYEQALAINRKVLGEGHPDTATSLGNLGFVVRQATGDFAAARPYYEQSLAIRRKALGEGHSDTARSRKDLGLLLAAVGEQTAAADQFVAAAAIYQHLLDRELFTLSEAKMELLLDESLGGLDVLASLPLAELQREEDAAEMLLSRKAIAFEVLNRRRSAEFLAASDFAVARNQSQLLVVRKQLDDLAMHPPKNLSAADLAERRQALRKESEELENQLGRALAGFLGTDATLAVSLETVRGKLPADAAMVEFFRYHPFDFRATGKQPGWKPAKYAAFVFAAEAPRPVAFIDLGPAAEIDALIGEISAQVEEFKRFGRREGGEADAEQSYRGVAAKLYAKLLAPLEPALGGAKQIFVGPDSRLHEIPFEALVDGSGKYLVESGYQFAYVNSGRDLVRKRSDETGSGVFVFAGPNYDEDGATRLAAAERLTTAAPRQLAEDADGANLLAANDSAISRSADTRLGWRHLPGADLEGQEAAAAFAHGQWGEVHTYTGDEALEDLVKKIEKPRVLVFVTHGDFLEDQPLLTGGDGSRSFGDLGLDRGGAGQARAGLRATEDPMLRSYLLLAGANKIDEKLPPEQKLDNGWLTAQEIGQLDLRGTDLVVLSACNTGRGRVNNGQAVTGMRSAFLFAGARTIVGSLYEVPNAETRQLMKPFYEGVAAGKGKLASLTAAKLAFLAARRAQTGAAHPFYWASFVLVGEP